MPGQSAAGGVRGFLGEIEAVKRTVRQRTAWRLDGTLREFPKFEPKNLWFRYPVHVEDTVGVLKDLQAESEMPPHQRGNKKRGENQGDLCSTESR